jgi:hypothetical protein
LYYLIFLYWDKTYKEPTRKEKSPSAKGQRAGNGQAPLTFSTSNLIIQELRKIYKLKELIGLPIRAINHV